ncbi:MAG TPA: cupredoxin domain-containing protein [Dehalococcoidia bacterium]|nr:cupredoxin domain-containing protein [Dehalococcoidia bacterium]
MKLRFLLTALVAVLAVVALAAACGDDDDEGDVDEPTAEASDGAEVQELTITPSDELVFEPDELTVQAGQSVELTVDNSDNTALHDWTITEIAVHGVDMHGASEDMGHMEDMEGHEGGDPDLHIAVDGGGTATITFIPTEPGEYEYHCTVLGHAEAGMVGTLVVTE